MPALFSLDALVEPTYIDIFDVAAGYCSLNIPVDGFFTGDRVDAVFLTIQGTGMSTIALAIDQTQRLQGYYQWTAPDAINAGFTLTTAQTAAIAAATNVTYNVQAQITRSGNSYTRECQAGQMTIRPSIPSPPLIVSSIVIAGGPVSIGVGGTVQLSAIAYDAFGNVVPGVAITWTSQSPTIATVSSTGLVTGIALGASLITAQTYGVTANLIASINPTPFTLGSMLYADTISTMALLALGTAGQFLEVNNGATAPQWHTLTAADVGAGTFKSGTMTMQGSLLFSADALYDIGASGATRPRDIYGSRNLVLGGTTNFGGIAYTWPGSQAANRVLKTDGAGTLSWSTPTGEIRLEDLTDVTITSVADKNHLVWDAGTSMWVNSTDGSTLTALNATQLTTGTVPNGRLSGAYTGVTGLGTLAADLLFVDATYDIGKSGATRPRDIFASRNLTIGGTAAVTGTSTFTALATFNGGATIASGLTLTVSGATITGLTAASVGSGAFPSGTYSFTGATTLTGGAGNMIIVSGTGASRTLVFQTTTSGSTATTALTLNADQSFTFAANGSIGGNLIAGTDASFDLGASGASRFRDFFLSRNATIGGTVTAGAYNGQTITSSANFTGSVTIANTLTVTTGTTSLGGSTLALGTNGSGSNIAAGNVTVTGALSTGSGTPSTIIFQTTHVGSTGSTPQTLETNLTIGDRIVTVANAFTSSGLITASAGATVSSGQTLTLTGATVAGSPTWSASQAITLSTAAQPNVTSLGTLAANLLFVDATYDIGASGATRPRDLFMSRNLTVGGTVTSGAINSQTISATANFTGTVAVATSITVNSNFSVDSSGNVTGVAALTMSGTLTLGTSAAVTGGAGNMTITAGTGNSRTMILRSTTSGGTATAFLTGNADQSTTFGGNLSGTGSWTLTGGAGSMTIIAGTGNSRTMTLQSTTSGGTATTFLSGDATQQTLVYGNLIANSDNAVDLGASGANRFRNFFLAGNATIGGTVTSGAVNGVTIAQNTLTFGAGSTTIVAGTGASRTLIFQTTTSGSTATTALTLNADQTATFAAGATFGGNISGTGSWTITGGAGSMTIVAGTGNSRTLTLQSTTSGGTATTALQLDATQQTLLSGNLIAATDATYDLGASGANRFRDFYLSRNALISGTLTATGVLTGNSTTDSSSSTTGGTILAGGLGVAKKLYAGTSLNAPIATLAGNNTDNTLSVSAGTSQRPASFGINNALLAPGILIQPGGSTYTNAAGEGLITINSNGSTVGQIGIQLNDYLVRTTGDASLMGTMLDFFDTLTGANTNTIVRFQRKVGGTFTAAGSITTTNAPSTAYNTSSDDRLKIDLGIATSTDLLRAIIIHDVEWRMSGDRDRTVFAQEAYKVTRDVRPHFIHVGGDELGDHGLPTNPWGADYSKLVPDLVVGWQSHDDQINALKEWQTHAIAKYPDLALN